MGRATAHFLAPPPGEGLKGQIIKFQLQSQFQRFLNQTLCVFSYMKDIKHIRQDFHLAAWVMMPPGVGLGGTVGVIFFFEIQPDLDCVSYLHEWHMHRDIFGSPPPGALGRGQKVKYR